MGKIYRCKKRLFASPLKRWIPVGAHICRWESLAKIVVADAPTSNNVQNILIEGVEYDNPSQVTWFYAVEPPPLGTNTDFFTLIGSFPDNDCGEGTTGIQGPQGPGGSGGGTGGSQGNQGIAGSQGNIGAQGNQGVTGLQGNQGPGNIAGPQGYQGTQGNQGLAGLNFSTVSSAYGELKNGVLAADVTDTLVDFDVSGVSNAVTISLASDTITVLRAGTYLIEFSGDVGASDVSPWITSVQVLLNGSPIANVTTFEVSPVIVSQRIAIQTIQELAINDVISVRGTTVDGELSNGILTLVETIGIGPQGIQGKVGVQGNQGNQGLQGLGESGTQGPQGLEGAQGVQGISGGGTGNQGSDGLQGSTGSQGSQGFGLQGPGGATGPVGDVGPQGFQGLEGDQGPQGITGATGNQGFEGPQGPGPAGPQGNQGFQGAQGNQGLVGVTGVQGNDGSDGVQGPQGNAGVTGVDGAQGSQGFQGFQGLVGVTGVDGLQGFQGFQGAQGFQGSQGFQGAIGATGFQGNDGSDGLQGFQGIEGITGPTGVSAGIVRYITGTDCLITATGLGVVFVKSGAGVGLGTITVPAGVELISARVNGVVADLTGPGDFTTKVVLTGAPLNTADADANFPTVSVMDRTGVGFGGPTPGIPYPYNYGVGGVGIVCTGLGGGVLDTTVTSMVFSDWSIMLNF